MFTLQEKAYLLECLVDKQKAVTRAKGKASMPEFGPLYDKLLGELASLAMKVQGMEVTDGKGKVSSRS